MKNTSSYRYCVLIFLLSGVPLSALAEETLLRTPALSGQQIYLQSCAICHGADGESMMPGVPDLAGNTQILDQSDAVLVSRIIDGYQSPGSTLAMPAKGGNPELDEQAVSQVLRYMRRSFR